MGIEVDISKIAGNVAKGIGDTAAAAGKGIGDAAGAIGSGVVGVANSAKDSVLGAANAAGEVVTSVISGEKGLPVNEDQIKELLGACYENAISGIPNVSKPIEELVDDYASKYDDVQDAARAMVNMQLVKNATSGFLSGVAGFLVLPVQLAAIPANIANVLYVQLRMAAALAKMGGYDVRSDQVQTFVYACIAGTAASDVLKDAGIKVAGKLTESAIKQVSGKTLTKINQAVGFRLITKFGETGVVNLGKLIPVAGGVIGGAFDFATTQAIANVAYGFFIGESKSDVIDEDTIDIAENEMSQEIQCIDKSEITEG